MRNTVRSEREAPSAAASCDPTVAVEYPASGETQDLLGSVLVPKSGRVDDDVQVSALDPFCEMDGRKSRFIGEVLDWYRGEDAGDLKRSEVNELVENLACLNALEETSWKSNQVVTDEKSGKTWKSNQNSVLNEELVQNVVMNEQVVKNFVLNAKIDPKVVMDLSIFLNWWMEQFATHQSKTAGRIY